MNQKSLIYGTHAVLAVLSSKRRKVFEVLYTNNTKSKLPESALKIARLSTDYEIGKILEKKGKAVNHQGLLAFCSGIVPQTLKDVNLKKASGLVVILDSLTDVTNIGTIIRSCVAFNVDFILYHKTNMPEITANDAVSKNACGGLEMIDIVAESNLANAISTLKKNDYWVVGMEGSAKMDLKEFKAKHKNFEKLAIVLGSEGSGMRDLTAKLCDFIVKINISGQMESLNVSVAAAIALYELSK